jgi:8-oxo-dGTP diphosphatase
VDPPQLLSSHFPRCMQTLEPLAKRLGQKVIPDDRLAEGAPLDQVLDLVATVPDNTVMCSHGDVIPDLIDALHRRGAHLTTDPDWRKASMWVLTRENGKITALAAEPPPKIDV